MSLRTAQLLRGMRRFAGEGAWTVSLLALIVAVAFWARSYGRGDYVQYRAEPWQFDAASYDGALFIGFGDMPPMWRQPVRGWDGTFWPFTRTVSVVNMSTVPRFLCMNVGVILSTDEMNDNSVAIRWWFIAACSAILPAMRAAAVANRLRCSPPGCCAHCGYDLRASPSRCPECGQTADGILLSSNIRDKPDDRASRRSED